MTFKLSIESREIPSSCKISSMDFTSLKMSAYQCYFSLESVGLIGVKCTLPETYEKAAKIAQNIIIQLQKEFSKITSFSDCEALMKKCQEVRSLNLHRGVVIYALLDDQPSLRNQCKAAYEKLNKSISCELDSDLALLEGKIREKRNSYPSPSNFLLNLSI